MNTRQVRLNLSEYDLNKIYNAINPVAGQVEMVKMEEKADKQCDNMSEKNIRLANGRKTARFFVNCIGIYFSTWSLKLFRNGTINAICFPDEATYENDMDLLFDILKSCDYAPYVVSQKDILTKNA